MAPALGNPASQSPQKNNGDERAVKKRLANVGFYQPIVVDHAGDGADVDGAVQHLPALAAETTNPTGSGSKRQRNQQDKSEEADGDERALGDIFPHRGKIEGLFRPEIGEEVQASVKKSEKAKHAAEADQIRLIEKFAERSDGQGADEKAQDPITGRVLKKFDGIGAKPIVQRAIDEAEKRDETKQEDDDFGPFAGENSLHAVIPDQ